MQKIQKDGGNADYYTYMYSEDPESNISADIELKENGEQNYEDKQ